MKVSIDREEQVLVVELEDDERIRKSKPWGGSGAIDPDSLMWHKIKTRLNADGMDFIKKRMWKDGHLVDEIQQYIRERNKKNGEMLCCYHDKWSVYNAVDRLNEDRAIVLPLVNLA